MSLKGWEIKKIERKDVRDFIEKWHYSKSINGCIADFCFALFDELGEMKGAMFYGRMAMANQWKKYGKSASDVIELRRLCCVDETPKNAESYFIGATLKKMKKEWNGDIVVSYSDLEYGHEGTIYQASNFEKIGKIKGAKKINYNGKLYHDKTIRTKYKGKLKPFAIKIKNALETGEAFYVKTAGKVVYTYKLKKRGKRKK